MSESKHFKEMLNGTEPARRVGESIGVTKFFATVGAAPETFRDARGGMRYEFR